jgi:hypothetical protein
MVYIKSIEPSTFLHFYRRGDAFCLRDYARSPSIPPREVLRRSAGDPPPTAGDIWKIAEQPGNFILEPPESGIDWKSYKFWHEATVGYNRAYLNHQLGQVPKPDPLVEPKPAHGVGNVTGVRPTRTGPFDLHTVKGVVELVAAVLTIISLVAGFVAWLLSQKS